MSPFLTARARERGPIALSYAATAGAAFLVMPTGGIALAAGDAIADAERLVRVARRLGAARECHSFNENGICVHTAPIGHGWFVCSVATLPIPPTILRERLGRASRVLALALTDRERRGSPPSRAAAEVAVASTPRLREPL